jgi:hypothetical protein
MRWNARGSWREWRIADSASASPPLFFALLFAGKTGS